MQLFFLQKNSKSDSPGIKRMLGDSDEVVAAYLKIFWHSRLKDLRKHRQSQNIWCPGQRIFKPEIHRTQVRSLTVSGNLLNKKEIFLKTNVRFH